MQNNSLVLASVTTCMNRSFNIKRTLPYNLESSKNFKNAIFTLVNYGSKDDLDDFVKNNLMDHINNNKLKYVKVLDNIEFFHHARAKNIGIKLSNADIIFNSDAEWFSNASLFELIFEEFTTGQEKKTLHIGGRGGAIVNYKKHIIQVGGYDEDMIGWGFEDSDLFNRFRYGFDFEHKRTSFEPFTHSIREMRRSHPPRDSTNVPQDRIRNNRALHKQKMERKIYLANQNKAWGSAKVLINFKEELSI
jgi:predicted glycosyltransferase involved in capsule biosynthesis